MKKRNGTITKSGYRVIYINGKRLYEHRYIFEKNIERKLTSKEVIHHKNGDKLDNRIENLEITNHSKHASQHHPKRFCEVFNCKLPREGKGFCSKHYQRFRKHGNPEKLVNYLNYGSNCYYKKCDRKATHKGFCELHYKRYKKYGDPSKKFKQIHCSIKNCIRKYYGKNICKYHFFKKFLSKRKCSIKNCNRMFYSSNLCQIHYFHR